LRGWFSVLFFGAKKSTKRKRGLKSHHGIYVRLRPFVGAGQRFSGIFFVVAVKAFPIEEKVPNVSEADEVRR
jgi:hypothetical protein